MLGYFSIQYDGPERPQQQAVHLGSIEYVAMGLFLAEGILIKQKRLTKHEINRSLLVSLSLHIKKSYNLHSNPEVPFEVSIVESRQELDTINIGFQQIQPSTKRFPS